MNADEVFRSIDMNSKEREDIYLAVSIIHGIVILGESDPNAPIASRIVELSMAATAIAQAIPVEEQTAEFRAFTQYFARRFGSRVEAAEKRRAEKDPT